MRLSVVCLVRVLVVAIKLHLIPVVVVGLGGVGAVFVVVDLAGQAVGGHALLGGHFVGAHLQRDGGGVTVLQLQLLVKDVSPSSWGCHASLENREQDEGFLKNHSTGNVNISFKNSLNRQRLLTEIYIHFI